MKMRHIFEGDVIPFSTFKKARTKLGDKQRSKMKKCSAHPDNIFSCEELEKIKNFSWNKATGGHVIMPTIGPTQSISNLYPELDFPESKQYIQQIDKLAQYRFVPLIQKLTEKVPPGFNSWLEVEALLMDTWSSSTEGEDWIADQNIDARWLDAAISQHENRLKQQLQIVLPQYSLIITEIEKTFNSMLQIVETLDVEFELGLDEDTWDLANTFANAISDYMWTTILLIIGNS